MLNTLVHRQYKPFPFAPCFQIFLVSVGTNEAVAIHPRHQDFFSLLCPELLRAPPLKHWQIRFTSVTGQTCWHHVIAGKVRPPFAFGNDVINRKLFSPFATISTGTLTKWPSQKIIFKNALTKSTFCITRAKFNERIKQLIRTIRSKHGTI